MTLNRIVAVGIFFWLVCVFVAGLLFARYVHAQTTPDVQAQLNDCKGTAEADQQECWKHEDNLKAEREIFKQREESAKSEVDGLKAQIAALQHQIAVFKLNYGNCLTEAGQGALQPLPATPLPPGMR